jgi:hypothetical protein
MMLLEFAETDWRQGVILLLDICFRGMISGCKEILMSLNGTKKVRPYSSALLKHCGLQSVKAVVTVGQVC